MTPVDPPQTRDLRERLQHALGASCHVERELGGGGMSRVFVGRDAALARSVVVKVLPPDLAEGVNLERFRREIQVAGQLQHPNLVPVLTAGQDSELLYYTMPLIHGETLRSLLDRERQLPLPVVLRLASDVAAALAYAHARNIVHRDIKPENILVEESVALVTDFGIARAIEKAADLKSVTSTGFTLGTPLYMSPEQAAAEKHLDGRSDIYSLACVVYEMLTGEPPFTAQSARTLIAKHLNEPPPSVRNARPDLPDSVDVALTRALAKSPAARYRTALEFVDALAERTRTGSVTAAAPTRERKRRRQARRRRRMALAVAAGATLVAAAVLAYQTRPPTSEVSAPSNPARIAVLPFDAPAGDSLLQTLGRGLAYDLVDVLRGAPGITIVSYYATQALEPGASIESVRDRFDVGTVITGRIERRGDSVMVDASLIDAVTSTQQLSIRRGEASQRWLLLRDTLVAEVGRALLAGIGPELRVRRWRASTRSRNAWELRQRAQDLLDRESGLPQGAAGEDARGSLLHRADSLLVLAGASDPGWPEPLIARGWVQHRRSSYASASRSLAHVDSGLRHATRALELAPGNPHARTLRGALLYQRWIDVPEQPSLLDSARAELLLAVAEDSTVPRAWNTLGSVLRMQNDLEGAAEALQRAIAIDAFSEDVPRSISRLIFLDLFAGRDSVARARCRDAVERYRGNREVGTCELNVLGYLGSGARDIARVWQLVGEMEAGGPWPLAGGISPHGRHYAAAVLARSGMADSARAVLAATARHLETVGMRDAYALNESQVRVLLGDHDAALDLLARSVARGDADPQTLRVVPWFAPLRDHPRFRLLLEAPPRPVRPDGER